MSSGSNPDGASMLEASWPDAGAAFQWETRIPRFQRIRQRFPRAVVTDIPATVARAMDSADGAARLGGGRRVAITAGSRGIAGMPQVLAAIVKRVREYGGEPFLVPAMGSHGRGIAEGQKELLAELGITPETVGAPIEASMEVVQLGNLPNGMPVYLDRIASQADAIIVANRVKPHTDFSGEWESGMSKMIGIGLGKRKGADTVHRYGIYGLRELLPQVARFVVQHAPIAMGIAVIENAYDEVGMIEAVKPEGIAGPEEAAMLVKAREMMASLPVQDLDVLLIDEMGKNVTGAGMDPNILGRMRVFGVPDRKPDIRIVAVLDITKESHGNATGIGLADVTTRRVLHQIDFEAFYVNGLTSGIGAIQRITLPVVAPDDRTALLTSLRVCGRHDPENSRVIRIKNTLKLGEIDVSESLWDEMSKRPNVEFIGEPFELPFGPDGRLAPFGGEH